MKDISVGGGLKALVDDDDFEFLSRYNWGTIKPGNKIYADTSVSKHRVTMHRFIMGTPPNSKAQVDHVNGDGLDNRKQNLRWANHSTNQANSGKRAGEFSSRFRGVHWIKRKNKWHGEIKYNYRKYHLGFFDNEVDAAKAYNQAAVEYFGEFARLNQI